MENHHLFVGKSTNYMATASSSQSANVCHRVTPHQLINIVNDLTHLDIGSSTSGHRRSPGTWAQELIPKRPGTSLASAARPQRPADQAAPAARLPATQPRLQAMRCGGFHNEATPKWVVYKGKSY